MEVSVVVPLHNEADNVPVLVAAIRAALDTGPPWELLLVDDGSTDATAMRAEAAAAADPRVRVLRLAQWYGQTAALRAGFEHSRGRVVVSLDGDLQNDPRDIPRLVATLELGYDVVAGCRDRAGHTPLRRLTSRLANRLVDALTGAGIRDTGCTLRAYRLEVLRALPLYSDLHRFIPVLAAGLAGARVTECPVTEHPRRSGRSKYGLGRAPRVLIDLVTLVLLHTFSDRPFTLFAYASLVFGGLGVAGLVWAGLRLGAGAVDLVLPAVALLFLGQAGYLLLLGLVTQMMVQIRTRQGSATLASMRERT